MRQGAQRTQGSAKVGRKEGRKEGRKKGRVLGLVTYSEHSSTSAQRGHRGQPREEGRKGVRFGHRQRTLVDIRGAFAIPSKASSYAVEKLGKRFFEHRYFVENLAARFAMIAPAREALFLLASLC